MRERLQKYIARYTAISRRHAEEQMAAGRVTVNGDVVKKMGSLVDPDHDQVSIAGRLIEPNPTYRYLALNKPVGVVCTRAQFAGEKTVYDLVPDARDLVIAGRLDKDSAGLVILTNDGELTNRLTHPRYGHTKEYVVTTSKAISPEALAKLRQGIRLDEGRATIDSIEALAPLKYRIVMHQGWKRQIRRMIGAVHNDVLSLTRVRLSSLELGNLALGKWRVITREEIG